MCLICVEFNKKRMTREEVKKALPEMVMFAKTEEDRNHYKKLQSLGDSSDENALSDFIDDHISKYGKKIS
nr:hypothetical protein BHI3_22840 [Bacteriovorax sp. HI3]